MKEGWRERAMCCVMEVKDRGKERRNSVERRDRMEKKKRKVESKGARCVIGE